MLDIYHVYISYGDEACHTETLITSSLDKLLAESYADRLKNGHEPLPEHISISVSNSNVSIYVERGSLI